MRKIGRRLLLILATAGLTTSCETVVSDIVTPDWFTYSPAFLGRAADELETLGPSCDRVEPADGCSAVQRMIRDYGVTRDQIRALNGQG